MQTQKKGTASQPQQHRPPIEEQNKDTPYDVEIDEFDPAKFDQSLEPEIVEIRTDEVALDLWTFLYDLKTKQWDIAGIYRTGLFSYLESQQFHKRYWSDQATVFLIKGEAIIESVSATLMRDCAKAYIQSKPGTWTVDYLTATYEGRLEIYNRQQHLTINPTGLEGLTTHDRPLLRDTPTTCYIPYQNGIVEVTATGVTVRPPSFLDTHCVWKKQVLRRDYNPDANGEIAVFGQFINNVTNREVDRLRAFRTAIGYLIHHYGNPAEGQAIICYDEEITDAGRPEGGTGKGVFADAIQAIRPVAVIDGKKFDPNDKFCFQQVNQETAVVFIDDPVVNHPRPDRRFTLDRFFSLLTEGWAVEKKHEHAFRIPAKEGPKLLIAANVVLPNEGSSNIRRQFILEFSNHYKKEIHAGNEKPLEAEHGCLFYSDDWDAGEWQRFDQYMIGCVLQFLREGLQPYPLRSASQNRLRQTAGESFYDWITTYNDTGLIPEQEYSRDSLFQDYKVAAGLPDHEKPKRGFTNNISQYAKSKGWTYEHTDRRAFKFILTSI